MKIVVINSALREGSNTAKLAERAYGRLKGMVDEACYIDLRETPLPFCDAGPAYQGAHVKELCSKVESSHGVLLASPIYNYDLNSVAKNFLELTGAAWKDKVVGVMCTAGGFNSYMAPMSFLNSLMLDFRCIVVPRYVYLTESVFKDAGPDREAFLRVDELVDRLVELTGRINL